MLSKGGFAQRPDAFTDSQFGHPRPSTNVKP
jgi:hypothetical protein